MHNKLITRFLRILALLLAFGASSHAMADVMRLVTLDTAVYGAGLIAGWTSEVRAG